VCTDQIDGNSQYRIFRREGTEADPHDHSELVKVFRGGADATDGIDATTFPLGEAFPSGLFVAMNSSSRNFLLFRWRDIARAGTTKLQLRQAKQ
jgi:myo-inositol-hexaphosphate 3-phosphohydrolase